MNEQLKVIISAEIANFKSRVATAKKEIASFGDKVKGYSKDIDKDFKAIGESIGNGLKTAGTAVAGASVALLALAGTTAEYRTEQAKLATAFETAGGSAETAKSTYNDLYRVLGDSGTAVEAAGHLAKLTTEEKALNEWTTICQGVYATFGDSIPIEGLTEAANETAKVGTLTGTLADALNWAGVNEEAFQAQLDACNTEAEREALIRETLNGLYTDAATSYETNNAALLAQNEAQAALTENLATVGAALQPVLTLLTSLAADCLAVIAPYIQSFVAEHLPTLQTLLGGISTALETALGWIMEHQTILGVMAGIIGGIVAAIGLYNAVAAVKAAMDAAQVTTLGGLIAAQLAHAAAAAAAIAPYVLVVAAIAAVIAIIVLCVKNWDTIKAKVVEVATAIWTKVKEMATKVAEWFGNMKEKITEAVNNAKQAAVDKFNEIKDGISEKVSAAKTAVANKFGEIKTAISDKVGAAKTAVVDKFNEIKTGMSDKINAAKTAVSTAVGNIVSNFTTKFTNAKTTVLNIFDNIKNGLSDKINAAKDAVGKVVETIKGFFNFKFNMPHIPKPSFGISPSGWKVGDLLKGVIPKLSIKWNAQGGVFDKPTLFGYGNTLQGLGEAGAEAVVPLEKNTQWLDKIAEKLSAKQGSTPIVLMVDGKVFAQTTIDSINQLTKQTGSLALNLY